MSEDSRTRSLAKMASYRVVVFALLAAITFYFTGNEGHSTVISVVFNLAGSVVYYAYERLWGMIGWGRMTSGTTQGAKLVQSSSPDQGRPSRLRGERTEVVPPED